MTIVAGNIITFASWGVMTVANPAVAISNASAMEKAGAALVDKMGESITYRPFGGVPRSIMAIVDREPVGKVEGTGQGSSPQMTIEVKTHAINGITAAEVNAQRDTVDLFVHLKDSGVSNRQVGKVLFQDEGTIVLEVR